MAIQTARAKCAYLDCRETAPHPHLLCAIHWLMRFDREIIKCRLCGAYRPKEEPSCENCARAISRTFGNKRRQPSPEARRQHRFSGTTQPRR